MQIWRFFIVAIYALQILGIQFMRLEETDLWKTSYVQCRWHHGDVFWAVKTLNYPGFHSKIVCDECLSLVNCQYCGMKMSIFVGIHQAMTIGFPSILYM